MKRSVKLLSATMAVTVATLTAGCKTDFNFSVADDGTVSNVMVISIDENDERASQLEEMANNTSGSGVMLGGESSTCESERRDGQVVATCIAEPTNGFTESDSRDEPNGFSLTTTEAGDGLIFDLWQDDAGEVEEFILDGLSGTITITMPQPIVDVAVTGDGVLAEVDNDVVTITAEDFFQPLTARVTASKTLPVSASVNDATGTSSDSSNAVDEEENTNLVAMFAAIAAVIAITAGAIGYRRYANRQSGNSGSHNPGPIS